MLHLAEWRRSMDWINTISYNLVDKHTGNFAEQPNINWLFILLHPNTIITVFHFTEDKYLALEQQFDQNIKFWENSNIASCAAKVNINIVHTFTKHY